MKLYSSYCTKTVQTYTYIYIPPFFFTMARDEVDPTLITNDRRKRKLASYATDKDNISADKEAIVNRMKVTASHFCEQ